MRTIAFVLMSAWLYYLADHFFDRHPAQRWVFAAAVLLYLIALGLAVLGL